MRSILRLITVLLALGLSHPVLSQENSQTCLGSTQDRYWQEISSQLTGDQVIDRLTAFRLDICQQLAREELALEQARTLWERALVDAVTVQAVLQKASPHRAVLRVYGTF